MGIVRHTSTRVLATFDVTCDAVVTGMTAAGMVITVPGNPVTGEAKRSLRRNRWASTVTAGVRPESDSTSLVDWAIDMAGDKHYEVLTEILATMPQIDDLGVADALDRLGKMGRFFGFREASALTQFLHVEERAVELTQGVYDGRQGMLVLTTERLFFFDKSALSARTEEFDLAAIGSLGFSQKLGGEVIEISISGRSAKIKQVAHGRAETFVQAFRRVRADRGRPRAPLLPPAAPDMAEQIKKLAELRDAGVLTEDEFSAKKADLLSRM
ncbi:SHOCT domain-containing protein [Gordonia sp. DT218]|uniref:SHOCT domain-containing protein n=1 Tax=Gordonia sp. DT218 TaxID=3416659 RepID=UPI003CF4FD93